MKKSFFLQILHFGLEIYATGPSTDTITFATATIHSAVADYAPWRYSMRTEVTAHTDACRCGDR